MRTIRSSRSPIVRLLPVADERGAILVEYTAVFAFVIIVIVLAIVKLGPVLVQGWAHAQTVLLAASP